jgi:hypothetical protein
LDVVRSYPCLHAPLTGKNRLEQSIVFSLFKRFWKRIS